MPRPAPLAASERPDSLLLPRGRFAARKLLLLDTLIQHHCQIAARGVDDGGQALRRRVRAEWTALYDSVAATSGADEDAIHFWFAEGMLMNVAAIVGGLNPEIDAKLARGGAWH